MSLGQLSASNLSTPARSRHSSSTFYGGHRAQSMPPPNTAGCWYRSAAMPGAAGGGGYGPRGAESSSSSMVSLHNVRLSSWGSLPSRKSSESPEDKVTDKEGGSKEPSQGRGGSSEPGNLGTELIEESRAELAAAEAE